MEMLNKVCVVCGKPFSVQSQWKVKICCGKECAAIRKKSMQSGKEYQKWRYEIEKAKKKPQERFCGICGKSMGFYKDMKKGLHFHEECIIEDVVADFLSGKPMGKSKAYRRGLNCIGLTVDEIKEIVAERGCV